LILSKVVILNAVLFAFLFGVKPPLAFGASQAPKRLHSNIDESQTFVLRGNTRPVVTQRLALDQGGVSGSQAMPRMSVHFTMTAAQRTDLDHLLAAQQNRRSPQYRKFLTPEEYANRFGLNTADIEKVTRWLENNGFSNVQAARSRTWVSFSGTAAQAQAAFRTPIHKYLLNGEAHLANSSDPQLPKGLEAVAGSVSGLHDFHMKPRIVRQQPHFTSGSGSTYLAPDDWETIYDVKPLYSAGLDGSPISGQTYSIVVVGQSDIKVSDLDAFRTAAGLPVKDPTVLVPPGATDPGVQTASGDEAESDLDLEWAGAIAKNANILFVTASGVEDAIAYAIDNDVAPILSTSYGSCEPDLAPADFTSRNALFAHAAALGMTIVAATGDAGAAACDTGASATLGLAVDFPASSQYVTGVGGTALTVSGSGTYFGSTNNGGGGSATSYIPEVVWNESNQAATGGGVSVLIAKPSWQTGTGVPSDGFRDVPDIAFTASLKQDGLLFCSGGSCTSGFLNSSSAPDISGGTSAGPPTFSGVLALLVQKTGAPVGLLNPNLYSLAAISTTVFHDITGGNNQVICQGGTPNCPATATGATGLIGYSAGVGYDLTTGWGSLDSYNFVEQWSGDIAVTASPTSVSLQPGSSTTATISVAPVNNFSGAVSFACSVSGAVVSLVTCSVPSTAVNTSGSTTVTITAAPTIAATHPWRPFRRMPPLSPGWFTLGLVLAAAIPLLLRRRFVYPRSLSTWSAAGVLVLTLGAVSCGSGTSSGGTVALMCNLPANAQVGVSYIGSCVASGGTGTLTYSISAGALPGGLSINPSTGAITGIPTAAGGSAFTVSVTGGNSQNATEAIAIFDVAAATPQSGVVTVTATSGGIVNTASISVTVL
jgi:subtilase family serine protease